MAVDLPDWNSAVQQIGTILWAIPIALGGTPSKTVLIGPGVKSIGILLPNGYSIANLSIVGVTSGTHYEAQITTIGLTGQLSAGYYLVSISPEVDSQVTITVGGTFIGWFTGVTLAQVVQIQQASSPIIVASGLSNAVAVAGPADLVSVGYAAVFAAGVDTIVIPAPGGTNFALQIYMWEMSLDALLAAGNDFIVKDGVGGAVIGHIGTNKQPNPMNWNGRKLTPNHALVLNPSVATTARGTIVYRAGVWN